MAEPMEVGIAGSVAGLAANAMERAQAIGDLIKGIRNAPRNLVRVGDELNDLQMVLAEAKSSPVLGSDGAATGALQDYLIELENIKVQVEALEQIANETSPCAATASSVHKRRDKNELKALLESIQRRKITTCMILLSSAAREHSRLVGTAVVMRLLAKASLLIGAGDRSGSQKQSQQQTRTLSLEMPSKVRWRLRPFYQTSSTRQWRRY